MIYLGKEVYTDFSDEEISEWLLTLDETALEKFKTFFEDMPSVSLTVPIECKKCGMKTSISYDGLEGFFGHR